LYLDIDKPSKWLIKSAFMEGLHIEFGDLILECLLGSRRGAIYNDLALSLQVSMVCTGGIRDILIGAQARLIDEPTVEALAAKNSRGGG
jgi:hypothetical protein